MQGRYKRHEAQIRQRLLAGDSAKALSAEFGVCLRSIYYVANRAGLYRAYVTRDEMCAVLSGRGRLTAGAAKRA